MEHGSSWETQYLSKTECQTAEISLSSVIVADSNVGPLISLHSVLPDELVERILAFLPIAGIFRAASVCKRWNEIVKSRRFLSILSEAFSQKPWYFMFTSGGHPGGYAYDPVLRKWYKYVLPCIETSNWYVASSASGLICFVDNSNHNLLYICNPITRDSKELRKPPDFQMADYNALAIAVDRNRRSYNIVAAKSKQMAEDFLQWNLAIDIYDSDSQMWVTSATEVLRAWRGGDESVICGGLFYCLIYSTGMVNGSESRHGLIVYDLTTRPSKVSLMQTFIPVPCSLTCGRLMNLKDRLVMVGGIGRSDRPGVIRGIGIWVLQKTKWQEVTRMPQKFFKGFGEFHEVFASSGTDDIIYIQSYGAPALLIFDMTKKLWKWSQRCPLTKKFSLQLFTGFSFEPRLEVSP